MLSFKRFVSKLNSDDPLDLLPVILIIILVACIILCIAWMIVSLVKKRALQRRLSGQREAAATAFFAAENLRILNSVYTPSGEVIGKLSSYQPVMYSIKPESFDFKQKDIKPLSVETNVTQRNYNWIHLIARMPSQHNFKEEASSDYLAMSSTSTSRLKFASLNYKLTHT